MKPGWRWRCADCDAHGVRRTEVESFHVLRAHWREFHVGHWQHVLHERFSPVRSGR